MMRISGLMLLLCGLNAVAQTPGSPTTMIGDPVTSATVYPGNPTLIIDRPDGYTSATTATATVKLDWRAGTRLVVVDRKAEMCEPWLDPVAGWFLVRPLMKTKGEEYWIPGVFIAAPRGVSATTDTAKIGEELVDRWNGLPQDYEPDDLVSVRPRYDEAIDNRMRREAAEALHGLIAAAKEDGVRLYVVSAWRSWERQQKNYQAKLERSGWEQNTVARPGHSEHQLGTVVDLTDGDENHLLKESFGETRAGKWLRENAGRFGFRQSYTVENQKETGYAPEPWHFRYWGKE